MGLSDGDEALGLLEDRFGLCERRHNGRVLSVASARASRTLSTTARAKSCGSDLPGSAPADKVRQIWAPIIDLERRYHAVCIRINPTSEKHAP